MLRHRICAVRQIGEVVELDLGRDEPPVWIPTVAVAGEPFARLTELTSAAPGPRA